MQIRRQGFPARSLASRLPEGCTDIREYFKTKYSSHVHTLGLVLNDMMAQIDPVTGKRYALQHLVRARRHAQQ